MAKQLKVSLSVDADTKQAKAQIEDLYKTLGNLSAQSRSSKDLFNTQSLKEGIDAAKELRTHLEKATDVNTGKLNLSAFSASLKQGGKSLQDYKKQLESLGPEGEEAFLKIRKSIAMADAPLRKTNAKLQEFATTLKNTARWQISSSILHGFSGALSTAFGYAKDLNESLNDIRIVTGLSADEMDKFAVKANKAARALSTTTTAYSDAALIFFQQGLSEADVEKRTQAVIKMSQAAGESATDVSSYMTAIWNNFDDGSKSLEYYGDVVTALGAKTAASSAEIAEGLEKFAAIGETIGLSYEFATAAVATVVDKTRQSADTVGTAFKTIFARLQGLQLGETLEDGVDLNKYSQALKTVGVEVVDLSGNLRKADDIINDLGATWGNLTNAQQTALAQTVAGTRQYTQLMSLMNNFSDFQNNVATAEMSEGTLQEQADIYAESWDAAQDRVKAAAENIYSAIIDDDFFIDLADIFANILDGVKGVIDGMGGMEGILSTIGGFITQQLAKEAPAALNTVKENLMQITGLAKQTADMTQAKNLTDLKEESKSSMVEFETGQGDLVYATELRMLSLVAEKKMQLNRYSSEYSEAERVRAEQEISDLEFTTELMVKKAASYDTIAAAADKTYATLEEQVNAFAAKSKDNEKIQKLRNDLISLQDVGKRSGSLSTLNKAIKEMPSLSQKSSKELQALKTQFVQVAKSAANVTSGKTRKGFTSLAKDISKVNVDTEGGRAALEKFAKVLSIDLGKNSAQAAQKTQEVKNRIVESGAAAGMSERQIALFVSQLQKMGVIGAEVPLQLNNIENSMDDLQGHSASGVEALTSFAGGLMSLNGVINSITTLKDVFTDEDSTAMQKIGAAIGFVTTAIGMLNAVTSVADTLSKNETASRLLNLGVTKLQAKAKGEAAAASTGEAVASGANTAATGAETIAKGANTAATGAQAAANVTLMATMWPILAVTLALAAAFAGVAAVAFLFAKVIGDIKAASPEGQLNAAKEKAAALSTAFEDAKTASEELKSSIDGYNSAVATLDDCVEGTQEWKNALQEVNNQVLDLLSEYPELSTMVNEFGESAITYGDHGNVQIADWALDKIQNQSNQAVITAQAASLGANQDVRQAQIKVDEKNLADSLKSAAGDYVFNTRNGEDHNNYSASVAKHIADNAKELSGMTEEDQRAWLQDYFQSSGFYGSVDKWIDAIHDQGAQMSTLCSSIDANTAATKIENQTIAANYLNTTDVANSEVGADVISASGDVYEQYKKEAEQKLKDEGWGTDGIAQIDGVNDEARKIWREYLEAANINANDAQLTDTTGDDKNRAFVYVDSNGEEKKITLEAMREIKASADALAKMGANAEYLTKKFTELESSTNDADKALKDFIANKDFSKSSKAEFEDIANEIDTAGATFATGEDGITEKNVEAYLDQQFGDGKDGLISDDTAKKLGYNTAEEAVKAFTEALQGNQAKWDEVELPEGLISADKVALGTAQRITQVFKDINYGPLGEAAGELFVDGLNTMLEGVDPEQQTEALTQLMNIDWGSWNAAEQAAAIMKNFGVEIDLTSEYWKDFAANMQKAGLAQPDFTKIKSDLNEISALLNNLEFGSAIEEEDYQRLLKYNSAWADLFLLQADGSRKFIGNVEEMKKALQSDLFHRQDQAKYRAEYTDAIKDADPSRASGTGWERWLDSSTGSYSGYNMDMGGAAKYLKDWDADSDIGKMMADLGYSDEQIQKYIEDYAAGDATGLQKMFDAVDQVMDEQYATVDAELKEMVASTATNFVELEALREAGHIDDSAFNKAGEALKTALMEEASNLTELNDAIQQSTEAGIAVSQEEMANALIRLGEKYASCTSEIWEYQAAVANGNAEQITAAKDALEAAIAVEEAASKYGLNADVLAVQAKQIKALNPELKLSAKQAAQLAVNNQRLNKGISTLNQNFGTWKKTLKTADKTSLDYAEALAGVEGALKDVLGLSDDFAIPEGFADMPGVLDLVEQAATGSEIAINKLGVQMASASVDALTYNEALANAMMGLDDSLRLDEQSFDEAKTKVLQGITDIESNLAGLLDGSKNIGDILGDDWITALNDMALATGMSVDDMNSMLNSMGVQAEVKTVNVPQEVEVPTYEQHTEVMGYDKGTYMNEQEEPVEWRRPILKTYSVPGPTVKAQGYVQVASIGTSEDGVEEPIVYTGTGGTANNSSGGNIGGGVSKSSTTKSGSTKKAKKPKKSDVVDRYAESSRAMEKLTDALSDAAKAADRLYGKARLDNLKAQNALTQKKIDLLEQQKQEALEYLKIDQLAVEIAAKKAGLQAQIDDEGNITNQTAMMEELYRQLEAAYDAAGDTMDDASQALIDAIQEKIDDLKEAIDLFHETQDKIIEYENSKQDEFNAWQDRNYEQLAYTLELKIELDDSELRRLEYFLSKYADDFYSMAESASLLKDSSANYESLIGIYQEHRDALEDSYSRGEISQAAYIEGLKEVRDGLYEQLEALNELDKTMMHYYGDTLEAARGELDEMLGHFDHLTTVTDHYLSLMDLLGKSADYEAMGDFLSAQAKIAEDRLSTSQTWYATLQEQQKSVAAELEAARASGDEAAIELLEQKWEDLTVQIEQAEEEVLENTVTWAENMKAVIENNMKAVKEAFENALTGGLGFDQITAEMDRLSRVQDEYLTKTNQLYETSKLMRTANLALDKTDNEVSKQKIRNFIEETKSLQEGTKLSKYQLSIQQAKYELLQAEMALEDAKNAKSNVRLKRDSSGGYGYVYTADQDAIANAEQRVADAENNIYNLSLEAQQKYIKEGIQAYQDYLSEKAALEEWYAEDTENRRDEFIRRMAVLDEQYYDISTMYAELLGEAQRTSQDAVADNHLNKYSGMVLDVGNYTNAVQTYNSQMEVIWQQWDTVVTTANANVKGALDDSKTATDELKQKSQELATTINSDLIPKLGLELTEVNKVTNAYASQRTALQDLIDEIENYLDALDKVIAKENGMGGDGGGDPGGTNPNEPENPNNPNEPAVEPVNPKAAELAAEAQEIIRRVHNGQIEQTSQGWQPSARKMGYSEEAIRLALQAFNDSKEGGGYDYLYEKALEIAGSFASGGYTGAWGPDGKLAFLHEKELILNKDDTANMLAIVDSVRQITSNFGGFGALLPRMMLPTMTNIFGGSQPLEQIVQIEANFPSVRDRNEIEEAFNNLINTASQYVNTKRI